MSARRWRRLAFALSIGAASTWPANALAGDAATDSGGVLDAPDERCAARIAATDAVGAVGESDVDRLSRTLARLREADPAATAERLRIASRATRDGDVLDALDVADDPTARRAMDAICTMRALAAIGTIDAVRRLVAMANAAFGAYRPELLRELRALDDRSTAALIEARASESIDVRAWAKDTLDALGKRTPGDAVQTNNDQVLVDVLSAYARIHDVDAIPVVLSFVHSDRAVVRNAARAATLAYGKDATPRVRATFFSLTGQRLPDDSDPEDSARRLFDAYDHQRLRDVYARLEDGIAKEHAGDMGAAVQAFDDVLARQPLLDDRAEMAPAYVARARELEPTNRALAVDLLRKALRISDAGPSSDTIRSELAYLDGEQLSERGLPASAAFERALSLDPDNTRARAEIARLEHDEKVQRARDLRLAATAGSSGFALIAAGILGLARYYRRSRRTTPSRLP